MSRTDPQINIRLPRELLDSLATAATANKRSTSAEIVARLEASGETLRDRIAMAALPAMLSELYAHSIRVDAKVDIFGSATVGAYEFADAMLAERSKP